MQAGIVLREFTFEILLRIFGSELVLKVDVPALSGIPERRVTG